jgi:hypothetical protein
MGLLGSLFGGSKSKSANQAYGVTKDTWGGAAQTGANALNSLSEQLGSFGDFKKNMGFNTALDEGLRGTTGGAAAQGMLRSGPLAKSLVKTKTNLEGQFYNNWLDRIGQLGQLGLGAGQLISGAGGTSTGKSNGGIIPGLFG